MGSYDVSNEQFYNYPAGTVNVLFISFIRNESNYFCKNMKYSYYYLLPSAFFRIATYAVTIAKDETGGANR